MKKIIIFCLLFHWINLGLAQNSALKISESQKQEIFLYPYLKYKVFEAGKDNLSNLLKDNVSSENLEISNFPIYTNSFWLKCELLNTSNKTLSTIFNLGYLESVQIYHFDKQGKRLKQTNAGMNIPLRQRGIQVDMQLLERFNLPVGESTLLLHIHNPNNLHLSNLAYSFKRMSIKPELSLYELQYFTNDDRVFILLFLGAVALMFFYNTAIFFVLLDKNYLLYILYLFFAGAYFFINKGLYVEWLAGEYPQNKLSLLYVSIVGCIIFRLLFTRAFLELKKRAIWADKLIWGLIVLTLSIWGLIIIGQYTFLRNFTAFCMIVSVVSMWFLGFIPTVKQHNPAYFYLLGNIGLIIGASIFSLLTMNFLPSNMYTENAGLLGILFEMSLFSLGLANKINETKKELAQRKLEAERREKNLIEAKNKELEEKVIERTYDLKQTNEELQQTLETVEAQRKQIEEKNRNLISSINYAHRIQLATLPSQANITRHLPEMFVFYQPKDIVSGDFYWFSEINGEIFLVVADCTGHGVPGAFMTILGETLLDQIINRDEIFSPAQILSELDTRLLKILQQEVSDEASSKVNDGMDITILCLNTQNQQVRWASAKRLIWLFKPAIDEPLIYKGDKFPIGSTHIKEAKVFTEATFTLEKGDMIYTFTDGYVDQFGDEGKFTPKRFRSLLNSIKMLAMENQKEAVKQNFQTWKGHHPQTDDVLVFGLRI